MSRLLISEPPLQVLPTLAKTIGLNEAIVLQQVYYRSRRVRGGDGWVQRSHDEWRTDDFPFWSDKTIKRAVTELVERGLLERDHVATATGRELRLRVVVEALDALEGSGQVDPTGQVTMSRGVESDRPDALTKGTAETSELGEAELPQAQDVVAGETPLPPEGDRVGLVFEEWVRVTGRDPKRTVLDSRRRRKIQQALAAFPLDDVLDAVRGWRRIPHNCGQNERRTVYNDLELLLRNASNTERFRDAERGDGPGGLRPILMGPDKPAGGTGGGSFVDQLGARTPAVIA